MMLTSVALEAAAGSGDGAVGRTGEGSMGLPGQQEPHQQGPLAHATAWPLL
jgi:hypothetical protein